MLEKESDLETPFKEEEVLEEHLDSKYDDALIIFIKIINTLVKRVMINIGNSANILYYNTFQKLGQTSNELISITSSLMGFRGDSI